MRVLAGALAAALSLPMAFADPPHRQFDGIWNTILSCPNARGALGYSFEFLSLVKDDVLHGEKGSQGQPGWLQIDGTIRADGTAGLYTSGLVGGAAYAVGERPAGTAYGYHIDAQFAGAKGNGHRVEGRQCTVTFAKKG